MTHLLSKSKYIRGLQCERALWLDVHEPRLARYTAEQMRRFDRGRDYEYAFKETFPGAVDVSAALGRQVDAYPDYTSQLLDADRETAIFEAGFLFDEVLVLADVVKQRADGTLDIYEVKSGNAVSETYKRDLALQYYVISNCRVVNTFSLVYNNPEKRFCIVEMTAELQAEVDTVRNNVTLMKQIANSNEEPDIATGRHCLEPYACPYQWHCQQGARQLALF